MANGGMCQSGALPFCCLYIFGASMALDLSLCMQAWSCRRDRRCYEPHLRKHGCSLLYFCLGSSLNTNQEEEPGHEQR